MFYDRLPGAGYVCAHRGIRSLAPENTMLAAERSLQYGADLWEMDVQRSADGTLVVFHDDQLARTTDVSARRVFIPRAPWHVRDFTAAELEELNAGSWFVAADPFGTIADGEVTADDLGRIRHQRIPTFREALRFTKRNDFPMNVEIKDQAGGPGDLSIVEEVIDAVHEAHAQDLVLLSSFNHDYLARARQIAPAIPTAALVEGEHPEDIPGYLAGLGAAGYHPAAEMTDMELVRTLSGQGIRVAPYTVNDLDLAQTYLESGVFAVITDFAHRLRRLTADQNR